ncbi:hypothetical protein EV424DRAFT_105116 [Suillus variegatus]|nr:hypothetical protein EV424DRAFT_105116 [Suillus variegatus]
MASSSTLRHSLSPFDDEPAVSDSLHHRNHLNTMSSFNRPPRTFPPSDSSTSANPRETRFYSFGGTRTVTSPNSGATTSALSSAANMMSYHFNPSINFGYMNGYPESNVSSDRYPPYHREDATTTHTITANVAWSQNYYPIANLMPVAYESQHGLSHSEPVHNPPRYHSVQHRNTAQEGVDVWNSGTPVTDANYSPSYPQQTQHPYGYTPYPSQYASPNSDASSSSHHETSSYRCEPSHPDLSAYCPEAYHGPRAQREPQSLTSAAMPSYPNISHPSYRQPTIQPHENLPHRNSRSRQNSRRRSRSHTHGTHHSPSDIFSCGWLVGENKTCGFEGPLDKFKTHFRSSHLSGAQNSPNVCRWQGCRYRKRDNATIQDMRRDSAWRHVRETHLGIKRN